MDVLEKIGQLVEDLDNVYEAGYERGKAEGGYNQGFEAGKEAEYDAFWDSYQQNGTRKNYFMGFSGQGWSMQNLRPKYDVKPDNVQNMFYLCGRGSNDPIDLTAIEQEQGIVFDFSGVSGNAQGFGRESGNLHFNVLDFSNATDLSQVFYGSKIQRIERFILSSPFNMYGDAFAYAPDITYIGFEGTIDPKANLRWNFSSSTKLEKESILKLLNCLAETTSNTLTLGSTNLAKLTDEEKAIATQKGWTLA